MNQQVEPQRRVYYELLTRVGSKGKYQHRAILLFVLVSLLGASTFFVSTYLFYQQPFSCNGGQSSQCTQHVCSLPPKQREVFLTPSLMTSLGNQNTMMMCEYSSSITIMTQALLLGASFGLFMGMTLSDILGRKNAILSAMVGTCIGIALIMVFSSIELKCLGLVLWGAGAEISFVIGASYITEIVAEEERSRVYVKFNTAFAVGTMANAILFFLLKDWMLVLGLYYLLLYGLTSVLFFYYVESPPLEIIAKNKNHQKSYQAFMRIAHKNQIHDHGITPQEMFNIHSEYHQNQQNNDQGQFFTFLDLFKYPSVRSNFLRVSFTFFITMFLLYGPAILMQKLFSNIILSGIINGVSQLSTIPFLFSVNSNVNRREGLMAMFGLMAVFTFAQGLLPSSQAGASILLLVLFFVARFFINLNSNFFVCVINQTFPAQIRSIAYCAVAGVGRLSTLTIPFVPILSQDLGISYDVIFAFVGLIGVVASWTLRQTINIPPPEMIEELKIVQRFEVKGQELTAVKRRRGDILMQKRQTAEFQEQF